MYRIAWARDARSPSLVCERNGNTRALHPQSSDAGDHAASIENRYGNADAFWMTQLATAAVSVGARVREDAFQEGLVMAQGVIRIVRAPKIGEDLVPLVLWTERQICPPPRTLE